MPALIVLVLVCLLACQAEAPSPADAGLTADAAGAADANPEPVDAGNEVVLPNLPGCDSMDILFVIDNSESMRDEQANLAENLARFIETLRSFRDGAVEFRIGVTTTAFPLDLYLFQTRAEQGTLLRTADMPRPWLESTDPDLLAKFESLATVGTQDFRNEQALKAARAALTDRVADGSNRDFLREEAMLAIVIVTDEDDRSVDESVTPEQPIPVSQFLASFDALKGGRSGWSAAVIAGDDAPYCTSSFGQAVFATRLQDFVSESAGSAVFSSICEGDLSQGLGAALDAFAVACDQLLI